ncbi:pyridine nucleotide-disulfide oxidoreductase [Virgisporangium aliadipatigenens]|uniref:Pyridine nucleotide-disulfide oxidoreductase n=1 Tax=Virgisporangium aliadipatigenens TaxID=741659 RepID=A0A8J4DT76_9ACTN|nr:NAD(P)/FAD-dependent oxidoreductase [Virgisporangium aliadipatigenens]GIJ48628.1 pyridine nucleotide-disulfide oxidoreductase [Virgisporangium aliadipatigenens]
MDDALVVGGGPAGMSAALYLARYNRSVVLFDTARGRSSHHQTNHNYLGFPEGVPIQRLRELGRAQLSHYPHVRLLQVPVERLTGDAERGFAAVTPQGTYRGRTVVLATGVVDHYPRFEGWEPCVGISLFWCITCDGWENRGRTVLVVGHTDAAAGEALQLQSLTGRITLLTNHEKPEIGTTSRRRLAGAGIPVVEDLIASVSCADGGLIQIVHTTGGVDLPCESVFSIQGATPQSDLAAQLGVELEPTGWIAVDTEQKTSLPGVFAAGDVTALHSHQVTTAVHEGAQAASAANHFLYPEELKG